MSDERWRPRLAAVAAAVVFGMLPWRSFAHQQTPAPAPSQTPVFRSSIDLVQLDVSVLDKNGTPVHGLSAADFTVREDGKPQSIEHCEEIVVPEAPPPSAKWMGTVTSDVATNDLQDRRIVAIVLDDAMMINWPPAIKNAKQIANDTIDRLGANDLAAVIFTRDTTLAQEFTGDKARLRAAVDKLTAGFVFSSDRATKEAGSALTPPDPDEFWFKATVQVVANVADYLISIPQRRKVLVYVSIGVPFDLATAGSMGMGAGSDLERREMMLSIQTKLQHAIARAQRGNVSVYAFEPAGMNGLEGYFASGLAHNAPRDPVGAADFATLMRGFVQQMAENTGGRSFINTDNFTPGVTQMFQENASYYLLGYKEETPKPAGQYSHLDVSVNRPGVTVRARSTNYSEKPETANGRAPSATTEALSGLLPNPATPLRVTVTPFARPAGSPSAVDAKGKPMASTDSTVAITLALSEDAPAARTVEHIDLVTTAFTPDGAPKGTQTQSADVTIRPAAPAPPGAKPAQASFQVLSQMGLKPGRYQLRLAADDTTSGKVGSVFIDVDVPDFATPPLSLSGVILNSAEQAATAPIDALKPLIPIVPTTEREFSTTSQVLAFVRVYQGLKTTAAPVTLKTTIVDGHDATAFSTSATLRADAFAASHAADYKLDLPLTALAPGPYLLMFEASAGKATAVKSVVFAVASR